MAYKFRRKKLTMQVAIVFTMIISSNFLYFTRYPKANALIFPLLSAAFFCLFITAIHASLKSDEKKIDHYSQKFYQPRFVIADAIYIKKMPLQYYSKETFSYVYDSLRGHKDRENDFLNNDAKEIREMVKKIFNDIS